MPSYGEYLLVLTVQEPVNRWTAPASFSRTARLDGSVGNFADAEEAFALMLDRAISECGWSGNEREDVIVLHWSVTPMHPPTNR